MAARRIVSDPNVMMGKPVITGTRVTVETILQELGAGESIEQVVAAHSRLTRDDVLAAMRFGAVGRPIGGPSRRLHFSHAHASHLKLLAD